MTQLVQGHSGWTSSQVVSQEPVITRPRGEAGAWWRRGDGSEAHATESGADRVGSREDSEERGSETWSSVVGEATHTFTRYLLINTLFIERLLGRGHCASLKPEMGRWSCHLFCPCYGMEEGGHTSGSHRSGAFPGLLP